MAENIKANNNKAPLISVVMSVYNCEQYVAEAIESILNQTFMDFEYIIINDGSNDRTLEVIKRYKDPRIILISRENKGLVFSLNEGIAMARGKYLARMDGDDISLPKRFEKQIKAFEEDPKLVVCGTAFSEINGKGKYLHDVRVAAGYRAVKLDMYVRCPLGHSTCIMKTSAVRDVGGYRDIPLVEDYDLWSRMILLGRAVNLPSILSHYRIHPNSLTQEPIDSRADKVLAIKNRLWSNSPGIFDVLIASISKREHVTNRLDQMLVELTQEAEQRGLMAFAVCCKVSTKLAHIMKVLYG